MINKERKRERFLRDPLPVRLAGLAADLARVASSARHPTGAESVAVMLEESQYFIVWTAAAAEPEVQPNWLIYSDWLLCGAKPGLKRSNTLSSKHCFRFKQKSGRIRY